MNTLEAAVKALAGVCDGAVRQDYAGFNGFDSAFGKEMARIPESRWSPRQKLAVWNMLRKYRKQLEGFGINYGLIPKPEADGMITRFNPAVLPGAKHEDRRIEAVGNQFGVYFNYNPDIVADIKRIPKAWFVPDQPKHWLIQPEQVDALAHLAKRWEFSITDEAREIAKLARAAQAREAKRKEENVRDSETAAGDVSTVEGVSGTLRPFQGIGVRFALRNERIINGDEMGLGKTVQAIATVVAANAYPALIVCPASIKLNWEREIKRWAEGRSVQVLNGAASFKKVDFTVINYDILKKWKSKLTATDWAAVVLDESHYIKNNKAQRTKLSLELCKKARIRLLLTGTPVLNRPIELVTQLEAIDRLKDFGGFWPFVKQYCDAHAGAYGWDFSGATNLQELNFKLRQTCYIRRKKEEVLKELPPIQRSTVPLPLDNLEVYRKAERDLISWVMQKVEDDKEFRRSIAHHPQEEQRRIIRERQNDAAYRAKQAEHLVRIAALKRLAAQGKLAAAIEWIKDFLESGEKLVVFAHHKEIQQAVLEAFPGEARIFGDDTATKRQENVDRFQNDPECKLMVASLRAAREGITLTAASNAAFLELDWTPAAHDQAEARVHRIGQNANSVNAYYLLAADSIDLEIAELLDAKRSVVDRTTEGTEDETKLRIVADLMDRLQKRLAA